MLHDELCTLLSVPYLRKLKWDLNNLFCEVHNNMIRTWCNRWSVMVQQNELLSLGRQVNDFFIPRIRFVFYPDPICNRPHENHAIQVSSSAKEFQQILHPGIYLKSPVLLHNFLLRVYITLIALKHLVY